MGGRFDATNIVTPLVPVITNISLEHTDILGKEVSLIASEKAGIIKDRVPVVCGATGDALYVIEQIASQRKAPVTWIDPSMWKRVSYRNGWQEFLIQGSLKEYAVKTSMLGRYQGENITVAIKAIEQLQMRGVYLTDRDILDGAHNPAGMDMLVKTLQEDFSMHHLVVVFGVLKDKDLNTMVSAIVPISDVIIVTKSCNSRAADPLMLKEMVTTIDVNKPVFVKDSIPQALEQAKQIMKPNDLICVTGSLFTVGEARKSILKELN